MDILYRIKRGNKYYKGKSKFTKYGTYFRKEQIEMNIEWVLSHYKNEELSIITYDVCGKEETVIDSDIDSSSLFKIIERNEKINNILKDGRSLD